MRAARDTVEAVPELPHLRYRREQTEDVRGIEADPDPRRCRPELTRPRQSEDGREVEIDDLWGPVRHKVGKGRRVDEAGRAVEGDVLVRVPVALADRARRVVSPTRGVHDQDTVTRGAQAGEHGMHGVEA